MGYLSTGDGESLGRTRTTSSSYVVKMDDYIQQYIRLEDLRKAVGVIILDLQQVALRTEDQTFRTYLTAEIQRWLKLFETALLPLQE